MPLQRCTTGKSKGWKWGTKGACHRSKKKAIRQALAIQYAQRRRGQKPEPITANARTLNPLKLDPSRLGSLRRTFFAELNRHFVRLKQAIRTRLASPWRESLATLEPWLASQAERDIVGSIGNPWWKRYIAQAYHRGASRVYDEVNPPFVTGVTAEVHAALREDFLDRLLRGQSSHTVAIVANAAASKSYSIRDIEGKFINERAFLLAKRLENEMKGVTTLMTQKMGRTLIEGIEKGWKLARVARELGKVVDVGKVRALLVARTELQRAHAEGQLDAMEASGVEEMTAEVEWRAGGDRPCPKCEAMAGTVLSVDEARGMIPKHPRCMCSWRVIVSKPKSRVRSRSKSRSRPTPLPVPPAAVVAPVIPKAAIVPVKAAAAAAAAAAAGVPEAKAWEAARATLASLQSQRQALGGLVTVPEVVDTLVAKGMTREQANQLLLKWANEDRIVLQVSNDPGLDRRGGEFIRSARGWLGFVRLL